MKIKQKKDSNLITIELQNGKRIKIVVNYIDHTYCVDVFPMYINDKVQLLSHDPIAV